MAKSPWMPDFIQSVTARAQSPSYSYQIIVDGGEWEKDIPEDPHYNYSEMLALRYNAVWSYYNGDAPTAAARRLGQFFMRLMGTDLPGEIFPAYTFEEFRQIAWYLNKENFNSVSIREGAIKKYEIGADGRPTFQIGYAEQFAE